MRLDPFTSLERTGSIPGKSSDPLFRRMGHLHAELTFKLVGLLIVLLSSGLQFGCLKNELVIDDFQLVQNLDNGRGCGNDPVACFRGKLFHLYYRPMFTASFAVVQKHKLHSDLPVWFHLDNLVLHTAVVGLAICFFRLVLRRRGPALLAGALFALHPVQVCVTTFIGGRTDTLALFFILPFAIGVIKAGGLLNAAPRLKKQSNSARLTAAGWILFSTTMFLAGIFTKEQVIPLLFVTPLLVKLGSRGSRSDVGATTQSPPLWLGIYVLPVIAYVMASHYVLRDDKLPNPDWGTALHIEMVGRTIWYFFKLLFAPTVSTLHMSTLGAWDTPQYGVAFLGYACLAAGGYALFRIWPYASLRMLGLWTLLTLVTCFNIIPVPSQFASPYRGAIPLIGLSGLMAVAIYELPRYLAGRRFSELDGWVCVSGLLALVFAWCSLVTVVDVPNWKNEVALMAAELDADPNYIPARAAFANSYLNLKVPDYAGSLNEYTACLQQLFGAKTPSSEYPSIIGGKSLLRNMRSGSGPRYDISYIQPVLSCRGWDYQVTGDIDNAILDYKAALCIKPGEPATMTNLAVCYGLLGEHSLDSRNYPRAAEELKLGLQTDPDNRQIRDALIGVYRIQGEKDKADALFRMEDRFTNKIP